MDYGWIATVITAMVAAFGLFFGRSHWQMLQRLIDEHAKRIDQLVTVNAQMRVELDTMEKRYYEALNESDGRANVIDNYVAMVDKLDQDNIALREENEKLIYRLEKLNPLPKPSNKS